MRIVAIDWPGNGPAPGFATEGAKPGSASQLLSRLSPREVFEPGDQEFPGNMPGIGCPVPRDTGLGADQSLMACRIIAVQPVNVMLPMPRRRQVGLA